MLLVHSEGLGCLIEGPGYGSPSYVTLFPPQAMKGLEQPLKPPLHFCTAGRRTVPAACTGARVPLCWKAPTCFLCSCESVCRRGGAVVATAQSQSCQRLRLHRSAPGEHSAGRTFSSGTDENRLLAAGRTLCPSLCHPGVTPVLAWLAGQWENSPSGKAGGTVGPASVLAMHVTGLMGQRNPPLTLLSTPRSLRFLAATGSGQLGPRAAPVCC